MAAGNSVGRQLGNYALGTLIGRGGMGEVYAATHRFLGTDVAVKTLRGAFADDENITHRFFLEARAAVEIAHPNVVRVLDFGQADDGTLYLVMERLVGRSLGAELAHGPLAQADAAYVASQICAGLAAAHGKGIIHRDLKPDNVFLTASEVKILDFGIAKVLAQGTATAHGQVIGTPLYMAPEQTRGSQNAGPRSDIYALGAILFEMVAGRPPFVGETPSELIASHLFEPPPRPSSLVPIDAELERVILCCLDKTPSARPATMAELGASLHRFIGPGRGLPAARAPAAAIDAHASTSGRSWAQSTLSSAVGEHATDPVAPRAPGRRRSLGAAAVGFVAVSALVVGLLRVVGPLRPPPLQPPPAAHPAAPPVASAPPPVAIPAAPTSRQIAVRSDPPGAVALVDGAVVGTTPLVFTHATPTAVTLSLRGHADETLQVSDAGTYWVRLRATRHAPRPSAAPAPVPPAPTPLPPRGESLD